MRAAVMRQGEIVVDDVLDPVPGDGEVLARTLACGICGSDLHALQHGEQLAELAREWGSPFVMDLARDVVLGHEFCVEVVELGPGVSGPVAVGDHVVSMPAAVTPNGMHAIGYSNEYPGGYAERMVLSAMLALRVPNGLHPDIAALTEPMAVGRHAVERSGIEKGKAALVLGCGPIGLAVIADLARRGIEPIIAGDPSATRRELASTLGATAVVDPAAEPAIEAWRRIDGARAVVIYEAVGVPGMIDRAIADAPRGTRIVVVGVCMEPDRIRPMLAIAKEVDLSFALGYTPWEFADTLRALAEGELEVGGVITRRVGIEDVASAFRQLANPERHCKILVTP